MILVSGLISAHGENFNKANQIINSNVSCDELTNEQLEMIGDYYMEQMHQGEAHEMMHKMMGGEDSETTRQMHISMAKSIYCNEDVGMGNMMNMMMDMGYEGDNNMMGPGMMNMVTGDDIIDMGNIENSYGSYNSGFVVILWVIYILLIILIVSAIYWLIKSANRKR